MLDSIELEFAGKYSNLDKETYTKIFRKFEKINLNLNKKFFNKNEKLFDYSPPLENEEKEINFSKYISIIGIFMDNLKNSEKKNVNKINGNLDILKNLQRINRNSIKTVQKLIDMN